MVTGIISGVAVVDCDTDEAVAAFLAKVPEASATRRAKTSRGAHFYFQWENGIRNSTDLIAPDTDVRGEGGFIIVPPSINATGKSYEWLNENETQPMPAAIYEAITSPKISSKAATVEALSRIPQGRRNSTLTSIAGFLRRKGLEEEAIKAGIGAINQLSCELPLPSTELDAIAKSMGRYEAGTEFVDSSSGSGKNFNPKSAHEILSQEHQELTWIWNSYIAEGDLFIFASFMKVGKSTFIYPLAMAVARGLPFLGYATTKGGVLVLALEENSRDVEMRLRKLGMTDQDPIYIHHGPLSLSFSTQG
jgi:bifunctional DNA primase/polymerase-like protein/AAA domain-containing protein/primase-like protein